MIVKGASVQINEEAFPSISGDIIRSSTTQHTIESSSIKKNDIYVEIPDAIMKTNHFMLMLQMAFSEHKAISITPDDLWLLICQGISEHIKLYEEDFTQLITNFEGKQTIQVRRDDFIVGEENPWEELFPEFTKQMSVRMQGDLHSTMVLEFSTSTIKETTAFEIAFMDTMSNYFDYEFMSMCGIPEIELKGTIADYTKILDSLKKLRKYNLDAWVDCLCPIIENIIETLQGHNHTAFWRSIYKENNESGGPYVTGWMTNFFPYIAKGIIEVNGVINYKEDGISKDSILKIIKKEDLNFQSEEYQKVIAIKVLIKNPLLDNEHKAPLKLDDFPNGLSIVPFKWKYREQEFDMNFTSGFIGIKEDTATHTLSTDINWMITK